MTETSDGMVGTAIPGETAAPVAEDIAVFRSQLDGLPAQQKLAWAVETYPETFVLTTSFGIQSAVLLHMLSSLPAGHRIPVIWVDTGYLPSETYHYADTLWPSLRFPRHGWRPCMADSGRRVTLQTWSSITG